MFSRKMMMVMVAAMFLVLGCTKEDGMNGSTDDSSLGRVSLAVVMDDSSEITTVHWAITDFDDDLVREGDIDVSDPSATISTYADGIPAGTGYTMTLTAVLMKDGVVVGNCSQHAVFAVTAGNITHLEMTLNCTLINNNGAVDVNANANICPVIDYTTVAPMTQAIGKVIELTSSASDKDTADVVEYAWTASIGTVANATQADFSYTCQFTGPVAITLAVTDNVSAANDATVCDVTRTINVTCVSAAICGDGVIGAGEQCDDSNVVSNDGCSSICRTESCGDGVVQTSEECDPAVPNGPECTADCSLPGCGNGILEVALGEACDDGNKVACDATNCSATCQIEACGNGIPECDEACDDGNAVAGDGCESDCTITVDVCDTCSVANCKNYMGQNVYDACYAANATDPALCEDVMECAHTTKCVTHDLNGAPWAAPLPNKCYCGTASVTQCMIGQGNGACKAIMETAAGTTDPMTVAERFADPNFAIGDAFALLTCEQAKCITDCL